jgi:hypothetical protein
LKYTSTSVEWHREITIITRVVDMEEDMGEDMEGVVNMNIMNLGVLVKNILS